MNINFKTHFPWPGADGKPEPTHFKAQVLNALHPISLPGAKTNPFGRVVTNAMGAPEMCHGRKLHTIRRVPANGKPRYREGMKLTFSTGSRFKPERFGEAVCTGVQQLHLDHVTISSDVVMNVKGRLTPQPIAAVELLCFIDGLGPATVTAVTRLAQNDGMPVDHFLRWFMLDVLTNGPGEYQIVHWTDLRY